MEMSFQENKFDISMCGIFKWHAVATKLFMFINHQGFLF